MNGMRELIERLGMATGPERELDAAITDACGIDCRECCGHGQPITNDEGDQFVGEVCCGNPNVNPAAFTGSIDAAMTLVPEGWEWALFVEGGCSRVEIGDPLKDIGADASTPAIALAIAALKARASITSAQQQRQE